MGSIQGSALSVSVRLVSSFEITIPLDPLSSTQMPAGRFWRMKGTSRRKP